MANVKKTVKTNSVTVEDPSGYGSTISFHNTSGSDKIRLVISERGETTTVVFLGQDQVKDLSDALLEMVS